MGSPLERTTNVPQNGAQQAVDSAEFPVTS